jgi:FixJ family two-component response regulator
MHSEKVIALVDDDPDVCSSISSYFRSTGLAVGIFHSAKEFLCSPAREETDCLVTDLHMTGLDGMEMIHRLKESGYTCSIIVVTAFATEKARKQAACLGVAAFLVKPVDPDVLLDRVKAALGG